MAQRSIRNEPWLVQGCNSAGSAVNILCCFARTEALGNDRGPRSDRPKLESSRRQERSQGHHGHSNCKALNKAAVGASNASRLLAELNRQQNRSTMAKIKLNPAVAAMSGKLGDMVHRRLW